MIVSYKPKLRLAACYVKYIIPPCGGGDMNSLPRRGRVGEGDQPPSSDGAAGTSLRSTFFTISVSLAWVGAGTPI